MRVIIKAEGRKFWIPVPLCLGGIGIKYALKYGAKEPIPAKQVKEIQELYKVFRKSIKGYKGLKIVEVKAADGEEVTIIL